MPGSHGGGGEKMNELITSYPFKYRGKWNNTSDDASTYELSDGRLLVFTTDSYTVDPIFFPGADIGHLAISGTINDLAVMGALPVGLSLSFVLEEGFPLEDLNRITKSIDKRCSETKVPIATGDTKVMGKGMVDKIIVNTSGVGLVDNGGLFDTKPQVGDKVVLSGGLGEHAVALLSKRFEYDTDIVSDSTPRISEIDVVRQWIKVAKDPTRGGIASSLNELSQRHSIGFNLVEEDIPVKHEVQSVCDMLGLNLYELACEGRFLCISSAEDAAKVVEKLKDFNGDAAIIGEVIEDDKVLVETGLGKRVLFNPSGEIVPRIC
jgi:hydrogenase expression/formation protein HypE